MTETTEINRVKLLNEINCLSVVNQLVETIWVDSPSGEIETCRISKENGLVRSIVEKVKYNLKSFNLFIKSGHEMHDIIISDVPSSRTITKNQSVDRKASDNINSIFINELDKFKNTQNIEFPFFRKGLLPKIMGWNRKSKLIEKITDCSKGCSWMIVSNDIFEILESTEKFEKIKNTSRTIFKSVGKMGDTNVYLNPSEERNVIYFGNYDSITLVINRNIHEQECRWHFSEYDTKLVIVEYLVYENGITKKLILE